MNHSSAISFNDSYSNSLNFLKFKTFHLNSAKLKNLITVKKNSLFSFSYRKQNDILNKKIK